MTVPLCFGQLSIWRSVETNPLVDGIRSQLPTVRSLPAGVTEQRVRDAVETLWLRHESLRTTFESRGGEGAQVVHASPEDVVEFRALATAAELEPCADELFARPFVLTKEFAWQFRVMMVADGTASVAISIHHILADSWALRVLFTEFDRLLADPVAAREALASPAPAPAALARQQHSDAWAARRSSARDHWTRVTEGFPYPDGKGAGTPGKRIRGAIDLSDVSGVVSDLCDRYRVTAQTMVLTLFALGIRATTGRERMVVHLMVANRLRPQWSDLVTSLNQIVPAGIVVDDADTVEDLLRHVQTAGLAAMRNGCYDVDEASAITGQPPGSTVDHVLNYMMSSWPRGTTPESLRRDGPLPTSVEPSTRPAIAGIYGVVRRTETPLLELHVDSNIYPDGRLRGFLGGTEKTLRLLSARQDLRVADLTALY